MKEKYECRNHETPIPQGCVITQGLGDERTLTCYGCREACFKEDVGFHKNCKYCD